MLTPAGAAEKNFPQHRFCAPKMVHICCSLEPWRALGENSTAEMAHMWTSQATPTTSKVSKADRRHLREQSAHLTTHLAQSHLPTL